MGISYRGVGISTGFLHFIFSLSLQFEKNREVLGQDMSDMVYDSLLFMGSWSLFV